MKNVLLLGDVPALGALLDDVLAEMGWRKLEAMERAGIYAAVLGVACEAKLHGIEPELLLRRLDDDDIRRLAGIVAAAI